MAIFGTRGRSREACMRKRVGMFAKSLFAVSLCVVLAGCANMPVSKAFASAAHAAKQGPSQESASKGLPLPNGKTTAKNIILKVDTGFVELTESMVGAHLLEGVSYLVKHDVTLDASKGGARTAGLYANNNLICIDKGATLTVKGADGSGTSGGLPGIMLEAGKSLCVSGEGKLVCQGGNAGQAQSGYNGSDGQWDQSEETYWGGGGGRGGDGAGGAGAGIGTQGGSGGSGGAGGSGRKDSMHGWSGNWGDGGLGASGYSGNRADMPGHLHIAGTVAVDLRGGAASDGAGGGISGSGHNDRHNGYYYMSGAGGPGGGGGGGGAADGYGCGGPGGGGGAGGGGGGTSWHNATNTSSTTPDGQAGDGGGAGEYCGQYRHNSGKRGTPDDVKKVEDGSSKGGYGGNSAQMVAFDTHYDKGRLSVLSSAKGAFSCHWEWALSHFNEEDGNCSTEAELASYGPGVQAWYVTNTIDYAGGKSASGATSVTFYTIAGSTKHLDALSVLLDKSRFPTQEGKVFKGYALTKDASEGDLLYNASAHRLDFFKVLETGLIAPGGEWCCTKPVTIYAVWENVANNYTVRYHANGGTFVEASTGKPYAGESYDDASYLIGKARPLWDNEKIGALHVNPPTNANGKVLKAWAKGVDAAGKPIGARYRLGQPVVYQLTDTPGKTVDLYAVWALQNEDIEFTE